MGTWIKALDKLNFNLKIAKTRRVKRSRNENKRQLMNQIKSPLFLTGSVSMLTVSCYPKRKEGVSNKNAAFSVY